MKVLTWPNNYDLRRQSIRAHIQFIEKKHSIDKRYEATQLLRVRLRNIDIEEYLQTPLYIGSKNREGR